MTRMQEGEQAVVEAIKRNDVSTVERVVAERPGSARVVDDAGVSALLLAKYCGRSEIADILRRSVHHMDIYEAAAYGDLANVEELVGGDESTTRAYSADGFTGLHLSSYFGHYAVVEYLLEQGAEVNAAARNAMRVRALHSAASNHHTDIVRLLLIAGADVNACQEAGFTALHAAAANGDEDIATLLVDAGADRTLVTAEGKTAADLAVDAHHPELAERLR